MNLAKHDAQTEMEMNMTPMIDVVFLLIIFFMIITDLTQQELEDLQLPTAVEAVEDKPDPKVVRPILNIDYLGNIVIKRENYYDPELDDFRPIEQHLSTQARMMETEVDEQTGLELPKNPILVRVDQVTPFKMIQKVMELCSKPGIRIWKMELAAAQPEEAQNVDSE